MRRIKDSLILASFRGKPIVCGEPCLMRAVMCPIIARSFHLVFLSPWLVMPGRVSPNQNMTSAVVRQLFAHRAKRARKACATVHKAKKQHLITRPEEGSIQKRTGAITLSPNARHGLANHGVGVRTLGRQQQRRGQSRRRPAPAVCASGGPRRRGAAAIT